MTASIRTHVLHVTHNMDFGGTEQVIRQIINGVDKQKFDSSIICIDGRIGEIGQQLMASGTAVYSISRTSGLDRQAIMKLRALLQEQQVDILHCHQYTPFCYGAFAAIRLGINVIFTEHGRFHPDKFTWKRRLVNQLLYRLANHIICISCATRQALDKYEWIPERHVGVIYNGVAKPALSDAAVSVRESLGIGSDTLVLGTISRLDPIKNQLMMLDALAEFATSHSNVALIIAGDGPERSSLEARASLLGVMDKVHFTGFITTIGDHLDAIDIFLLTSFSEGTSMTLLEAMALGKIIVATAVGGNVEVIDHERTGLLVDSNDTKALVATLIRLSTDESKRHSLSTAATVEYSRRFSMQTMAEAYQALYVSKDQS